MNNKHRLLITDDRSRNRNFRAAFTLAELLIATGITSGLVVMLGWTLGSLMSTASHANERVDAFRDARAALQMMERDLRNLVRTQWNPDPFSTPTPTAAPQPLTKPAAYFALDKIWQDPNDPYTTNNASSPNHQLFGLVADQTTPSFGDVCAVGYYCRWDNQLHAYSLRRFFRNSVATFNLIQNAGAYASDSVLYTPSANDPVLAAYVWNFQLTLYNSGGTVINTYPYVCDPNATTPTALPAAIEISFNAMSPQAARTVMSVSSDPSLWMSVSGAPTPTPSQYMNLIAPHAYQFRSRINLQ